MPEKVIGDADADSGRDSSISPPPTKRRRTTATESSDQAHRAEPLRIYSWNINGIGPFLQQSITSFLSPSSTRSGQTQLPPASLRDFLRRHDWPQVLLLQEVKINPDDASTLRAVERSVQQIGDSPGYRAHFCLPSDPHNARGFGRKVYGVCSLVRDDFSAQHVELVRPVSWDREGRFLVIETSAVVGRAGPKLAIINVYAVNGTDNPYKDPLTGAVAGTRHDRKRAVHRLLQAEVRELEARGFAVVVAGDLNVARAAIDGHPNLRTWPVQHRVNRADFEARFFVSGTDESKDGDGSCGELSTRVAGDSLDMIDTFRHLHPTRKGYTYYPRTGVFGESCDRVDMVLVSRSLGRYLIDAGMHETPQERGPSDHVPFFASLNLESRRDEEAA